MASRVKVNIARLKLIEVLEDRLSKISEDTNLNNGLNDAFVKHLENCLEAVKEDKDLPSAPNWNEGDWRGYSVWEAYRYRYDSRGYGNPKKPVTPLKDRIEKQIAILKLSEDEMVSVGINDELYELL